VPVASACDLATLTRVTLCPGQIAGCPWPARTAKVPPVKRFVGRLSLGLLGLALLTSAAGALVIACSSSTNTGSASAPDASIDAAQDAQGAGGSVCEVTRAYVIACSKDQPDAGDQLNCGAAKFDAWCAANDKAVNSESFRRAQTECLPSLTANVSCEPNDRKDCEYKTYATATPTDAQKQIALAYCQLCEPADVADCAVRKTTYDSAKGPSSVDDVFVAAWELNDALATEIKTKCTGSTADAGANVAACLKQFGSCAGGIYLDRLPDCP
jgi:hypothetical protein